VDALTRAAVAGTSREKPPASGLPTDELFEGVAGTSPERDLLLRAGALAVYRAAGRTPETGVAPPEPASEEALPACSTKAAEVIGSLLAGQRDAILREALERLRLAGLRLPHTLLPGALNVEQKESRPAVAAVLGELGSWLAGFNPAWTWATVPDGGLIEDDKATWQERALPERLDALRRVRGRDADQGRLMVEEVWKSEKADARVAMIRALENDLRPDDEAFLERSLDDRSVRVREVAADLLARLSGSAYTARAAERAHAVLAGYEAPARGLLGRRRTGKLIVRPPAEVDGPWRRDLPGEKPQHGVGEKAWRISQALSVVPPDHWEERFGVDPGGLLSAARGDWEAALLAGWCRATALHRATSWTWPLWERCVRMPRDADGEMAWEVALSFANLLPQTSVAAALERLPPDGEMGFRLAATLKAIPAPWASDLSDAFLEGLRKRLGGFEVYGQACGSEDPWSLTLPRAATSLHPESLEGATGLKELMGGWIGKGNHIMLQWERDLTWFEETLELRRRIVKEIPL
jgi:hypothetical protein